MDIQERLRQIVLAEILNLEVQLNTKIDDFIKKTEESLKILTEVKVLKEEAIEESPNVLPLPKDAVPAEFNKRDAIFDSNTKIEIKLGYLAHINSLDVANVPERRDEDLHELFDAMMLQIGISVDQNPRSWLETIFRIGKPRYLPDSDEVVSATATSKRPRIIIMRFKFTHRRNEVFDTYMASRTLNVSHLGFLHTTRIYVNEYMHPLLREVHYEAKRLRRNKVITKVIVRKGLLLIGVKPRDQLLPVFTKNELDALANSKTAPNDDDDPN